MLKKFYYYIIFLFLTLNFNCTNIENNTISPNSVPTPPQNLSVVSGYKKNILMWDSPSSNGGLSLIEYNVYRGETSGNTNLIKHLSPDSLSFTDLDTSLIIGNQYFYTVTAKNNLGEGQKSNEVIGVPQPEFFPPTSPKNFKGIFGLGEIHLEWNEPVYNGGSPIVNYKLYKGVTQNNLTFLKTLDDTSHNFIDSDISDENKYYYQISASNSKFEGIKSQVVSVVVPSLIYPANNSTVSTLSTELEWTNLYNSYLYDLQVSLNSSFNTQVVNAIGLSNSSYIISENLLNWNNSYYWRIRTYNSNDSSGWTSPFSFFVSKDSINPSKKVLVEIFTNTNSIPCVEANNYLDEIYNMNGITLNDANVIILRCHTTLFAGDPFYLYNTIDNNARMNFYPNAAIVNPRTFLFGSYMGSYSFSSWTNKINEKLAEYRTYAIKLNNSYDPVSRNGTITVYIKNSTSVILNDLVFHVAVAENNIMYNAPNGETHFENTLRDLITPPTGQSFTINPGQTNNYNINYNISTDLNQNNIDIVVFIQRNNNTTREVIAVEKVKLK